MATPEIGSLSPEADALVADREGWAGDPAEPLIVEQSAHDFSFWSKISNRQNLGMQIDSMAGHSETPTAALDVSPY